MLAVIACLAAACGQSDIGSGGHATVIDTSSRPDSDTREAVIYQTYRGQVTTKIIAERIRTFESADSTMAYVLDVDMFDSLGQVTSKLTGDSGLVRERSDRLDVFGNVVVVTADSTRLETDYLFRDPATGRIQTDAFVRITRDGDVITGWGLDADERLSQIKILRQVSGTLADPKQTDKQ